MTTGRSTVALLACMAWATACAGGGPQGEPVEESSGGRERAEASAEAADRPGAIRFVLELTANVDGPLYVLVNDEDNQPGWLRVARAGERVHLRERCEIPDCGDNAVCGAALPTVLDIAARGARAIEFVWDGLTSFVDASSRCETRQPAPPGAYVARFCYAREAELDGGATGATPATGRLVAPICTERAFNLDETEVVLRI